MAKIKQTLKCGCVVAIDYNDMVQVDYCPKHKAAPMMYDALKALVNKFATAGIIMGFTETHLTKELGDAKQALAAAEGKDGRINT